MKGHGIALHDILAGIWVRKRVFKDGGGQAAALLGPSIPSAKELPLLSFGQNPTTFSWSLS